MRYIAFVLFFLSISFGVRAELDHIVLRNGQDFDAKLYQVNDQRIVYAADKRATSQRHEVPTTDVYMVYVEGQGNIYLTPEGQRITGETKRVNRNKSDIIYLVDGGEIDAENIRITPDIIKYDTRNVNGRIEGTRVGQVTEEQLDKNQVFMICYRNGMNDIITPIEKVEEPEVVEEPQPQEPQYTVVFYSTERGDTLDDVASRFNVTVDQIKEWNDMPNQRASTTLRTGTQLMIYQLQNPAQ